MRMRTWLLSVLVLTGPLLGRALAQSSGPTLPPLPPPSPTASGAAAQPSASSSAAPPASGSAAQPSASASAAPPVDAMAAWQQRYDEAGRRMTAGDYAAAVQMYTDLAATAPTPAARDLALDQLRLATQYQQHHGVAIAPAPARSAGVWTEPTAPGRLPAPAVHRDRTRRSADELVLLYVGAVGHGILTGFFVDSLTKNGNPTAGASVAGLLLGAGFAGANVTAVALLDNAHLLRYGVPQSMFAGAMIGLGEGVAWNEWAGNRAKSSFHSYTKDMAYIWTMTTGGAVIGAIAGSAVRTTPGRSTWVYDVSFASGLFAAGLAGAASGDTALKDHSGTSNEANRNVGLSAALAGLGGLGAGIFTAGPLSMSSGRAHLIEAGWLGGSLFAGGLCGAYSCSPTGAFAAMAIGDAVGFVGTFFATIGMKPDPLSEHEPDKGMSFVPMITPTNGGLQIGLAGSL